MFQFILNNRNDLRFLRNDNFVDKAAGNCHGNQPVFFATDLTDFS